MVNEGTASQIQEDYLRSVQHLIEKAKTLGKSPSPDSNIKIQVGTAHIFNGAPGDSAALNKNITPKAGQQLMQAVQGPEATSGTVKMFVDGEPVFSYSNGQDLLAQQSQKQKQKQSQETVQVEGRSPVKQSVKVAQDYKQIVSEAAKKVEEILQSPAKNFDYNAFIEASDVLLKARTSPVPDVANHARLSVLEIEQNQTTQTVSELVNAATKQSARIDGVADTVANLYEVAARQQATINELQSTLDKLSASQPAKPKNKTLGNFIDGIGDSVKANAKKMALGVASYAEKKLGQTHEWAERQVDNLKADLSERADQAKAHVAQRADQVKSQAVGKLSDMKANVIASAQPYMDAATNRFMEAQGKIFSESVKVMLNFQGEKHPDGSKTFDSDNYHFRLDGPTGSVSVAAREGGVILAQGKVMEEASQRDIEALEAVNEMAQEVVESKTLSQTQAQVKPQSKALSR